MLKQVRKKWRYLDAIPLFPLGKGVDENDYIGIIYNIIVKYNV
jgi:hypothetical protein